MIHDYLTTRVINVTIYCLGYTPLSIGFECLQRVFSRRTISRTLTVICLSLGISAQAQSVANSATPVRNIKAPEGFNVELLYSVPKPQQGSWVNLCTDNKGRIIVSDQFGGLYRFWAPAAGQPLKARDIEKVPAKIRAAKPDAVFVFYPGKHGLQFFKQYSQAGLKDEIPLYSAFTVDSLSLPRLKDLALGSLMTQFWAPDLDNAANKRFVADYRKKTGRYPTFYAAQSYDTIMLISSAVTAVGGDLSNKDGMRNAMRKANFPSIRGPFKYGNNHFPIQNFYLRKVVKDAEGNYTTSIVKTVYTNHQDPYAKDCKMSW